jgi:protein-S-isoprenylcysteine O-methyltransferase Ste14
MAILWASECLIREVGALWSTLSVIMVRYPSGHLKEINMFSDIFKLVYLIEYVGITIVRTIHTHPYRREKVAIDHKTTIDLILLALVGLSMLTPLIYIFSSLFDFADYNLPRWAGWLGAAIFAVGIWLLWRSHADLGRSWTPTLGFREDHHLVTDGVFRYIRHPMYAAHLLWGIATPLMLHNWIAGFAFLLLSSVQYFTRIGAEEQMMVEQFGEEYKRYMERTGRIIPRL